MDEETDYLIIYDEVFRALAASPELNAQLAFKGARVLAKRLIAFHRQSKDLDSTLKFALSSVATTHKSEVQQLEDQLWRAISRRFDQMNPVQFQVLNGVLARRQRQPHPRGWDIYEYKFSVRDMRASNESQMKFDIAAPELFSSRSFSSLEFDGFTVQAATLERIAGEKLRAFLSCLPTYRLKIGETRGVPRRVKDLYDLARILQEHNLDEANFWDDAGLEFKLACESRCIDCQGLNSFLEDWEVTRESYEKDPTLPHDVDFRQADEALRKIVGHLDDNGHLPLVFPLAELE